MRCPLCGFEFKEIEAGKACQSCPIHKNCHLSLCPKCGYEFVTSEPESFRFIKQLFKKENKRKKQG